MREVGCGCHCEEEERRRSNPKVHSVGISILLLSGRLYPPSVPAFFCSAALHIKRAPLRSGRGGLISRNSFLKERKSGKLGNLAYRRRCHCEEEARRRSNPKVNAYRLKIGIAALHSVPLAMTVELCHYLLINPASEAEA